jgi:hypothetical protein
MSEFFTGVGGMLLILTHPWIVLALCGFVFLIWLAAPRDAIVRKPLSQGQQMLAAFAIPYAFFFAIMVVAGIVQIRDYFNGAQ